jgi:hypothetical protein
MVVIIRRDYLDADPAAPNWTHWLLAIVPDDITAIEMKLAVS